MCNDLAMWLARPLFVPMMGMPADTIYGMLPVSARSSGMHLDATIVNPDMARNFDDYPIENLAAPTLIIGARDDKLADIRKMERALIRFPDPTVVAFDEGGHLMEGHQREVEHALDAHFAAVESGSTR